MVAKIELTGVAQALKNINAVGVNVDKEVSEGLETQAKRHADSAKANVPRDTGELADTIRVVRDDAKQVVVLAGGAELERPYAGHVEYGTSKMDARPFMRPAAARSENDQIPIMKDAVNKAAGVVVKGSR